MVALVEDAESVPNNKVTVTAPIKQWHAFALNRRNKKGDRDKALQVIQQVNLLLPPANEVCEGYVFTRVCHSVHGGGGGIPACIAGSIPACLAAGLRGEGGVVSQHALQVSRPTPEGEV